MFLSSAGCNEGHLNSIILAVTMYRIYANSFSGFLENTGKYFSQALILASIKPQYIKQLFIDWPVQCMKTQVQV